jgi:uncharacterized protein (TIGR02186 family)
MNVSLPIAEVPTSLFALPALGFAARAASKLNASGMRLAAALVAIMLALPIEDACAQRRQRGTSVPVPERPAAGATDSKAAETATPPAASDGSRETVQADVSARRVAVTSSFSGTEIVVFGAVDNSRQTSPEAGLYDIIIVVSGAPSRVVARRKGNVAGMWMNVQSLVFDAVPSFYGIVSTRPLDEVTSEDVLKANDIGFDNMRMTLTRGSFTGPPTKQIKEFRDAVIRLKRRERLYQQEEYGVAFIGRSLFRASIELPGNVTVGPFDTRVYLFRDGELLSQFTARLNLEREGVEEVLHGFALRYPLFYGIATVLLAAGAGLAASTIFGRTAH